MWLRAGSRLAAARASLDAGFADAAVSSAYYAMLYAARAALSEEDLHAKTHGGTWNVFWETFATTGRFNRELAAQARATQPIRESADYDAATLTEADAVALIELAERFVDAVRTLVED